MSKKHLILTIAAAGVLLLTATVNAQTVAYDASVQPGNQGFTGNLGLDFNVNQPIVVTGIGAFDSNGDGFVNSIAVAFFNRDTMSQIGTSVTLIPGTATPLVNGDRIVPLPSGFPFVLPVGHYSIVAVGFSAADMNGNSTLPSPFTLSTENTGGGLISFVGTGRYDSNTTLDFPTTVPVGTPSNVFLAGTFQFQAVAAPTISKSYGISFGSGSINQGDTVPLTFTITNPNPIPLTGVAFTDTLPSGLLIQTPNGHFGSCSPGTFVWTGGTGLISLTNGTIPANSSCTFGVNVTGIAGGTQINTTSAVISNEAPASAPATASVYVDTWWLWFFY